MSNNLNLNIKNLITYLKFSLKLESERNNRQAFKKKNVSKFCNFCKMQEDLTIYL